MTDTVPVSVCLTTWNRAHTLPTTLDTLLAQTFPDFEIIICDDASEDHTEEVCHQYASKDKRIRYYRNPENLNMPGNLNRAIRLAKGTYIANLHDGDYFRSDLIAKWKAALDEVPNAAFVFNDYAVNDNNGSYRVCKLPFDSVVPGHEIALHYFRTVTSCVWGTVMARSSAYTKAGAFEPYYGFLSDVDMWLRLSYEADAVYVSEPLILLGPRPADHPFRRDLWRSAFWSLGIYVTNLRRYQPKLPLTVEYYRSTYSRTRHRYLLRTMLSCIRHGRIARVREGLAIWRDSVDPVLRAMGQCASRRGWRPDWYSPSWWDMTQYQD